MLAKQALKRNNLILVFVKQTSPTQTQRQQQRYFSQQEIGKRNEKPWDYTTKRYGLLGQITDSTMRRLGENSLLISVEGNFGSGKSAFAKELAKKIDFVYAREPDLEEHFYKMPNGNSRRTIINDIVKNNARFHADSLDEWHLEPTFKRAIALQHQFYLIRFMQMRTALLHVMSTGQGVVLERTVFSDSVIGQAMYENNLMSNEAYKFYMRDLIPNTIRELWHPHACIYLDKSPEECLHNIKTNGKPHEKESKVYTLNLLKSVENNYKKMFLPEARTYMHVMSYAPNEIDTERVIDDLELLDFEDQTKFHDWRMRRETTINMFRKVLSNHDYCWNLVCSPTGYIDVPEYLLYGEEYVKLQKAVWEDPRYSNSAETGFKLFGSLGNGSLGKNWL